MGTSASVHPVFQVSATIMEAAQLNTMYLHSFLGLDLPAALPHHSLLANGHALPGGVTVP